MRSGGGVTLHMAKPTLWPPHGQNMSWVRIGGDERAEARLKNQSPFLKFKLGTDSVFCSLMCKEMPRLGPS